MPICHGHAEQRNSEGVAGEEKRRTEMELEEEKGEREDGWGLGRLENGGGAPTLCSSIDLVWVGIQVPPATK